MKSDAVQIAVILGSVLLWGAVATGLVIGALVLAGWVAAGLMFLAVEYFSLLAFVRWVG